MKPRRSLAYSAEQVLPTLADLPRYTSMHCSKALIHMVRRKYSQFQWNVRYLNHKPSAASPRWVKSSFYVSASNAAKLSPQKPATATTMTLSRSDKAWTIKVHIQQVPSIPVLKFLFSWNYQVEDEKHAFSVAQSFLNVLISITFNTDPATLVKMDHFESIDTAADIPRASTSSDISTVSTKPILRASLCPPPLGYSLQDRKLAIGICWFMILFDSMILAIVLYYPLVYATNLSLTDGM